MASDSEVYRIDSQEDIVTDKENSDEVCDSQRQAVEVNSQLEVAVDNERNKEVGNLEEEEVAMPPNIIQILLNMPSSIDKMREENKGIKESQDSLKDSLTEKMDRKQDSLTKKIERSQDS